MSEVSTGRLAWCKIPVPLSIKGNSSERSVVCHCLMVEELKSGMLRAVARVPSLEHLDPASLDRIELEGLDQMIFTVVQGRATQFFPSAPDGLDHSEVELPSSAAIF